MKQSTKVVATYIWENGQHAGIEVCVDGKVHGCYERVSWDKALWPTPTFGGPDAARGPLVSNLFILQPASYFVVEENGKTFKMFA